MNNIKTYNDYKLAVLRSLGNTSDADFVKLLEESFYDLTGDKVVSLKSLYDDDINFNDYLELDIKKDSLLTMLVIQNKKESFKLLCSHFVIFTENYYYLVKQEDPWEGSNEEIIAKIKKIKYDPSSEYLIDEDNNAFRCCVLSGFDVYTEELDFNLLKANIRECGDFIYIDLTRDALNFQGCLPDDPNKAETCTIAEYGDCTRDLNKFSFKMKSIASSN